MKKRSLNYENKFRKYLFSFPYEEHKEICKNINVVESTERTRQAQENDINITIQKLLNDGYMYEVRPGIFEGIINNKKFKFEIINKRFEDQEE